MERSTNIDRILRDWEYQPGEVVSRILTGEDGRRVLQMRIELGVLQLEVDGRPDGEQPGDYETYYDLLVSAAIEEGEDFALDEERCHEIDREFVQFYHRRICWLALREYQNATRDAEHTLALMDFSSDHAPDEDWALSHEQYRPFVLFHRTQASALAALEDGAVRQAIDEIGSGLQQLQALFAEYDAEDHYDDDLLVQRLNELRDSIREHYELGPTLAEQLNQAVADEEYELAARLRDEMQQKASKKTDRGHAH